VKYAPLVILHGDEKLCLQRRTASFNACVDGTTLVWSPALTISRFGGMLCIGLRRVLD
jgi:hypothetical protein